MGTSRKYFGSFLVLTLLPIPFRLFIKKIGKWSEKSSMIIPEKVKSVFFTLLLQMLSIHFALSVVILNIYRTQETFTENIFHKFYFCVILTIIGNYAFLLWQPGYRMNMIYNTRVYM